MFAGMKDPETKLEFILLNVVFVTHQHFLYCLFIILKAYEV